MLTVCAAAGVGGCRSAPSVVAYARPFPDIGQQVEVIDIQVFKRATTLELVNTTNRAFGPCTLWLNQRFSCPLKGLAVGETLTLRLRDFRDEYSEPFRDASFFAVETPDKVVMAQIETPAPDGAGGPASTLVGLIVIGSAE